MIRCFGCMEIFEDNLQLCPHCGYAVGTIPKEPFHMAPGSILNKKYIVGRVLGFGGFGITYIGYDAQLDRKVAIKEYLPSDLSTRMPGQTQLTVYTGQAQEQFESGLKSFINEAKRLAEFNTSPNIVNIYDTFQDNNTGYIVMEYLEGQTVKDLLKSNGKLEFNRARGIILSILSSLKTVHKTGIIHRDISPDNIFITKNGTVKLLDFGAARYAASLHSKSLSVILKPGYAPEEQYRSRGNQGPWTDVYALAATFYKMLTGITPVESMERKEKDSLQRPSRLGVILPENAENAIMNALNINAEYRTQSAEDFERELESEIVIPKLEPKSKQIPLWLKLSVGSLAIILATFGVLMATGTMKMGNQGIFPSVKTLANGYVYAPGVLNKQVTEAQTEVEASKLVFQIVDKQFSAKAPKDKILSQDPLPARAVPVGTVLKVVVSGGAETAFVPDVRDKMKDVAIFELEAAGFLNETTDEYSNSAPGSVVRQEPEAGSELAKGGTVKLVISKGVEGLAVGQSVTIPSLVGKSFDEAKALLLKSGLYLVKGKEEYNSQIPKGQITAQNPGAGSQLLSGQIVSANVSLGVEQVRVPDVQYKSEQFGKDALLSLGLTTNVVYENSDTVEAGKIIRQDVATNTLVNKGSVIKLTVSRGSNQSFTVVYDANGGSNSPSNQGKKQDEKLILTQEKPTAKPYTITFDSTGGTVSPQAKTALCAFNGWNTASNGSGTSYQSGAVYSMNSNMTLYAQWGNASAPSMPVPIRDYYTFNGWYTSASGGTKVTEGAVISSNITLYAQWTEKPLSDWVSVSSVPSGAQLVNFKWNYTKTVYKDSQNTTESGWTLAGSEWVQTGTGSQKWASFPSGFDTGHWLYASYNGKRPQNFETSTAKRSVTSEPWVSFIYWHWMYDCGSSSANDRLVGSYYGQKVTSNNFVCKYFGAYESTDSASILYGLYKWRVGGSYADTQGSYWWYRFDVYQSYYTDYYKLFHWKKDEVAETSVTLAHTNAPSGNDISNAQEYVRYRSK